MIPNKSLGILLILISLLCVSASFGHEYIDDLMAASSLTVTPSAMEVTPGSTVVLDYQFTSTWNTRQWNFNLNGGGYDVWSPKVSLDYGETYYNSFSVKVPDVEGPVTYKIKPYFYISGSTVGSSYQKVTITVVEPQPETFTLTVKTLDTDSNQLPGVEVSIDTGILGTSDSTGTLIEPDLLGSYTVTGTKEGYVSDSESVSMTADRISTLYLSAIDYSEPELVIRPDDPTPEPTDTPVVNDTAPDSTEEPTATPVPPSGSGGGSAESTPAPTPVIYIFTAEILDNSEPQEAVEDVKVMINGETHYTDTSGKVVYASSPGDTLDVVITKEGYNTFQETYIVTSDTLVKITLSDSGGNFFLDLNLADDNPFYDNEGLFGVMPTWVAAVSTIIFGSGLFLLRKP